MNREDDTPYAMALTRLHAFRDDELVQAMRQFGSAQATLRFLNAPGTAEALLWAEQELDALHARGIRALCFGTDGYPHRLARCTDAPPVLYQAGPAQLNAAHVVSIVGSRHCTDGGRQRTRRLVQQLYGEYGSRLLVVSGLAEGIDICAQRQALALDVPTAAVLAHGLDTLYPAAHRADAEDMARRGALVSEYPLHTQPRPAQFLRRNRIIAGLADTVIVMECALRSGALSAMGHARRYRRTCMAWPGIAGETSSDGCLKLIEKGTAQPLRP